MRVHTFSFMGDSTTNRPAPAANGTLAKTPLVHLLVYALEKKLTGTIELFSFDKRAAILFTDGQPAKARTSEPVAHLGRVLYDLGHLTDEQLNRSLAALAKAKEGGTMLHGQLLLAQGLIDAAKLRSGLREQLARKLHHVAAMAPETKYAYYDGFDVLQGWGGDGDGIDPVQLLWGMLLEYAPWEHVSAALERVSSSPLRLVRGSGLERLRLKKEELAAAELLSARPMCASDLAKAARLNERTAQLLAYLLLVTKHVDVLPPVDPASEARERTQTQTVSVRPSEAKERAPAQTVSVRPSEARERAPAQTVSVRPSEARERTFTQTASVRPSEMRERTRTSTTPAPPGAARRMTPSAQPTSIAMPQPPPNLAPDLAERWHEINERAATIDRTDYFVMLGVARDATHAEVESAFFALAKRWHPDRIPPELAPVRLACSRVFARMSEAHGTLTDDEHRDRYMRLLADGSGSPETQATVVKVLEAATNFQKAEVCLRRNDLVQAETFCRKALEDDATQPDYLAMLAWLVALKPESHTPEKTSESIQMLERAIAMSDRCEKAYFWRGMLYKRVGKSELAVKDFKRAVDLNARNIDAAREVRLYHMRGGRRSSKPPPPKRSTPAPSKPDESVKPGILGRLFKKS
jgi:tetratricopeptide (TPR) repeat protein